MKAKSQDMLPDAMKGQRGFHTQTPQSILLDKESWIFSHWVFSQQLIYLFSHQTTL